jgi:1-acyl-sn-glycerol-3-phosphate acyltransferase
MSGNIRMIARIAALILITIVFLGIRLTLMVFTVWFHRLDHAGLRFLYRGWAKSVAIIAGIRVVRCGHPPLFPFFMVTNHLTYLDGLVLAGDLGCTFVAKSEVASYPVLGWLAKQVNVIFVVREKRSDTLRVNEIIKESLDRGEGVIMFAESTTSRGLVVEPFKTALFEAAARYQFPVHYATLHYSTPAGRPPPSEWVVWWRPISFGASLVNLLRGRTCTATITYGAEPFTGTDRKILAQQVHDAVQAQFTPIE